MAGSRRIPRKGNASANAVEATADCDEDKVSTSEVENKNIEHDVMEEEEQPQEKDGHC